jgi:hypothetical protein
VQAVTAENYGLCGGMAFSSLDYWLKGWVVPRGTRQNDQPQRTTPTGTALRDYIWNRLLQSVKDNVRTFLQWMAVLHFDGGPGASWLRDQTKVEISKLRARIKAGTPVTVGLIGTTWNPLDNHQVLVYGFEDNPDSTTTSSYMITISRVPRRPIGSISAARHCRLTRVSQSAHAGQCAVCSALPMHQPRHRGQSCYAKDLRSAHR